MKKTLENILIIVLIFAIFGFLGVYLGSYSLNAIDAINLRHEEKNRVPEVDRIIYVKAAIDREYKDIILKQRDYGFWRENGLLSFTRKLKPEEFVERIIERASKSFEYQFGIRFVLTDTEDWNSQGWDSISLIADLKEKMPLGDHDMIIGFTGKTRDKNARAFIPKDNTLGNYVLIPLYVPKEIEWFGYVFHAHHLLSYVLIHELGHTFGAVHPEEVYEFPTLPKIETVADGKAWSREALDYLRKTFSVMNLATGYFTTHFDDYNKEIILRNKHLPSK